MKLRILVVALATIVGGCATAPKPAPHRPHLQLLQSIPESQLFLAMNGLADSLGVHCDFCHVKEGDKWLWDSDAKPMKAAGLQMIRMTMAMNREHFGGRTVLTCQSCHRGSVRVERRPSLPPYDHALDRHDPLPPAAAVLERYRAAVGGAAATSSAAMTLAGDAERSQGRNGSFAIELAGRDKLVYTVGAARHTLDGDHGTVTAEKGPRPATPEEIDRLRELAAMFQPLKVTGDPAAMRVIGIVPIDSRSAYEVDDGKHLFYFDRDTGLLLRRITIAAETPLGPLPEQVDFDDYRDAGGGVMLPYLIRSSDTAPFDTVTRRIRELRYLGAAQ